jgi:sulfite reductase (NADPH) hemoprotein beta-component
MTHGDTSTYPRKADDFGFIPLEHTLAVAEAVVTTQRDWGNRVNRKNAKTKYTLDRVGTDTFKAEVEKRAGILFAPVKPYEFKERGDRIGWAEGVDGKFHLTLFIENGRILDYPGKPLKTGCRKIAEIHQGDFRMTANQNLIVAGVPAQDKARIEQIAREHGLIEDSLTRQRSDSMACVSLPTCPLAMAEAERYLPESVTELEGILAKHGLQQDSIIYRITGCPNGCGRAMLAEVGLVGKGPGKYNLHLGGNRAGTRIPKMYRENISTAEIMQELDSLIGAWAANREPDEGFGDFVIRTGVIDEVIDSARDFYA